MQISDEIKFIFDKIEAAGKEVFLVGGCVRDSIMGKTPHDYDFTTSATPTEIINIFNDYTLDMVGIAYGMVGVHINGERYEITTYRSDGVYSDNRHPDSISFAKNIEDDLARRDFTVNAIAYSPKCGIVDPFHGIEDIKNSLIKCVGDANERFNEDAVRIVRAMRFAAQLGFTIDEDTETAIFKNKELVKNVSKERYVSEFKKIMSSRNSFEILRKFWDVIFVDYPEFLRFSGYNQKNPHHIYDLKEHTLHAIENYNGDNIYVKIALLFHDVGKPDTQVFDEDGIAHYGGHNIVSRDITKRIMYDMRFERDEIRYVSILVLRHDSKIPLEQLPLQKWVIKYGEAVLRSILDVSLADCLAHNPETTDKRFSHIQKVIEALPGAVEAINVPSLKDLDVNGRDIMSLGFKEGKIIGEILNNVFTAVLDNYIKNEKSEILEYVKKTFIK